MKKTDEAVQMIKQDIENKYVLEVACGTAELSLSASSYARNIVCIDLDSKRLARYVSERANISFQEMDAAEMTFEEDTFDTVIIYNALYHIKGQYDKIIAECRRVLKEQGIIFIIATWKLDVSLMTEMFGSQVEQSGDCFLVRIGK